MPELPEVQTVVDGLISHGLPGCRIRNPRVFWPKTIAGITDQKDAEAYLSTLKGRDFLSLNRRGKYIRCSLSGDLFLIIHLRMTGRLYFRPSSEPIARHEHVSFTLNDERDLRFHDTRKFGRFLLTEDEHYPDFLGPEPFDADLTAARLYEKLSQSNRQMKPLLLDQSFIAGLGNIYVDESLWRARIHPQTRAGMITRKQSAALLEAIRHVLKQALGQGGTSLAEGRTETTFYSVGGRKGRNKDNLAVFRRTGGACPVCGHEIERLVVGQRGTHICPHCQTIKTRP